MADEPEKCPVDHKARAAWLRKPSTQPQPVNPPSPSISFLSASDSCDSSKIDQNSSTTTSPHSKPSKLDGLGNRREVSSIPRASIIPENNTASAKAANNEVETGADRKSGNWIYPSEQMFFNAMKRKNFAPQAADMKAIVPIHNAVNERAWMEIKQWEQGRGAELCGGPRLDSFQGDSSKMTPRARYNSLMGYTAPFDRHDWVIDRCGRKIEYVIDFYAGKDDGRVRGLSFYLDVRPKLNSWEGWKMRVGRLLGL
ncbi:MAG: Cytochrome c1 heme lyase [Trizodia sp. TS-e1964]|nr:MAG: Cytochrome c1 heme lyase [Trizodia sp. TS-e1964]